MSTTRTPEGIPYRCPTCGAAGEIERSTVVDDAPCPVCGLLLHYPVSSAPPRSWDSATLVALSASERDRARTWATQIAQDDRDFGRDLMQSILHEDDEVRLGYRLILRNLPPFAHLDACLIDESIIALVPGRVALKLQVIPVGYRNDKLFLATFPSSDMAQRVLAVEQELQVSCRIAVASPSTIEKYLEVYYLRSR